MKELRQDCIKNGTKANFTETQLWTLQAMSKHKNKNNNKKNNNSDIDLFEELNYKYI